MTNDPNSTWPPATPPETTPEDVGSSPGDVAASATAEPVTTSSSTVKAGQVVSYTYFDPYADGDVERVGLVVDITAGEDGGADTARILWFPSDVAHAVPVDDLVTLG